MKEAFENGFYGKVFTPPKITNGSKILIGSQYREVTIIVDRHFNRFQKKMIKWCFGFDVYDYSEEGEKG